MLPVRTSEVPAHRPKTSIAVISLRRTMLRIVLAMAVLILPWLPSTVTGVDAAAPAPAIGSFQSDLAIGGGIMIGAYDPARSLAGGGQDFDTWFVRQDDFAS